MKSIDLTPLYRNSIGYDRLATMLDSALNAEGLSTGYPPYNIEALDQDRYAITLAVAGFLQDELNLHVENGVLVVHGNKKTEAERKYLHQGIANRSFERKFNLAEHVEVTGAELRNGLLTINLVKEIPEAMKPRTIPIDTGGSAIEHDSDSSESVNTHGDQAA
ncbi:Hsp20 family protein [Pseudomaricurvus alcaniphilus]|uniref:Hsp20 family protein n=1 Tax=Pseudomaricurvus alcaniphilus TaxID=1166482 RepID=UPI0014093501|nr:Hsp20 family protein [Pseudomaricurvus alcaniphilus]NHN36957.1 Hsp20 family protein [Pseudomaricurvus alcaniphilus]